MAWRRLGDKQLSEPMMVSLQRHICVTRPQCVMRAHSVVHLPIVWISVLRVQRAYCSRRYQRPALIWNQVISSQLRSRQVSKQWDWYSLYSCIAAKFDGRLGSSAAERPINFHSDPTILNTNLAASNRSEIPFSDWSISQYSNDIARYYLAHVHDKPLHIYFDEIWFIITEEYTHNADLITCVMNQSTDIHKTIKNNKVILTKS